MYIVHVGQLSGTQAGKVETGYGRANNILSLKSFFSTWQIFPGLCSLQISKYYGAYTKVLDFAVCNVFPCIMHTHVFGPNFQENL